MSTDLFQSSFTALDIDALALCDGSHTILRCLDRLLDGMSQSTQSLLKGQTRERVPVSMLVANELFEQFIGSLEMVLSHARVVMAIQVGDRIDRNLAQRSPDGLGNRFVRVVLLHPSRRSVERWFLA